MAGGRHHRHAQGLQWAFCVGTGRVGTGPVLRPSLCVPRQKGRFDQGDLVGVRPARHRSEGGSNAGRLPVLQASRDGPVCLAPGQGREGLAHRRAALDAAGRHLLAHAEADLAPLEGGLGIPDPGEAL